MSDTPRLSLPLVQPSQAQKHVTVNEAMVRLDGLAQLTLKSIDVATPPVIADGECYGVAGPATDDWAGQEGKIAIASNGGWIFVMPKLGWRAWVEDVAEDVMWSGSGWDTRSLGRGSFGGGATFRTIEADYPLVSGGAQDIGLNIPSHAMVMAVSARVITTLTGTLTSWRLGTSTSDSQFGAGMGTALGSYSSGILGSPTTFYSSTPIRFAPDGGTLTAGGLRVAMSYIEFAVPTL